MGFNGRGDRRPPLQWEVVQLFKDESSGMCVQVSRSFDGEGHQYSLRSGKYQYDAAEGIDKILPNIRVFKSRESSREDPKFQFSPLDILGELLEQAEDWILDDMKKAPAPVIQRLARGTSHERSQQPSRGRQQHQRGDRQNGNGRFRDRDWDDHR